jgi:hypothetical protein
VWKKKTKAYCIKFKTGFEYNHDTVHLKTIHLIPPR